MQTKEDKYIQFKNTWRYIITMILVWFSLSFFLGYAMTYSESKMEHLKHFNFALIATSGSALFFIARYLWQLKKKKDS